jgi:hypothetical protein
MSRRFSILVGIVFILVGGGALAFTLMMPMLGWHWVLWGSWRFWPFVVVGLGLLFLVTPFLALGKRWLGGFFILGTPILATGGILLFTSLFDKWHAWEWLWPVEILSLALGFLLAAIYMRAIWLLLPAIIIGANGLVLQFCALTDLWELWAVLWTVEPLAVGLSFLAINFKKRSNALFITSAILCAVAAFGMIGMSALFPGWVLISALGPATLLLVGFLLLVNSLLQRSASLESAS